MRNWVAAASVALVLLGIGSAYGAVLTFDDLPGSGVAIGTYGGFSWSTYFYQLNGSSLAYKDTGYDHGRVSDNHVAYNAWENVVAVGDNVFDFNGAWLTGAWNDGLNVEVQGYLGDAKKYEQTVIVNTDEPTYFNFNYLDVDRLVFSSWGGEPNPVAAQRGEGHQFVLDNFTFNEQPTIPEPTTLIIWSLLGTLAIGIGWWRKRKGA